MLHLKDHMRGASKLEKEAFISSVRSALGRTATPDAPSYPPLMEDLSDLQDKAAAVERRVAEVRPRLLDRLAEVARLRGWEVYRAPGTEEALEHISGLAVSSKARSVVRSDEEVFQTVPVDGHLADLGVEVTVAAQEAGRSRDELRREIARADMGITGADHAIAETGSVVLVPRRGLGRLVSLAPPIHVALVRPGDVVESLEDFLTLRRLAYHRGGPAPGSYVNIITGPSRTADIEQTLVIGVHGPKEAHMVILEGENAG